MAKIIFRFLVVCFISMAFSFCATSTSQPQKEMQTEEAAGTPAAGMPATNSTEGEAPGTLTMSGKVKVGQLPLSEYTTVEPTVSMKVYSAKTWTDIVDASFTYDGMTSEYTVSGLPAVDDTLLVRLIFRNQTERFTLPGNYWLDDYFKAASITAPLSHDLQSYVVMHLIQPFDNAIIQPDIGNKTPYPSPVVFKWEPVPGAVRYVYKVDEMQPTPPYRVATPITLKSTQNTAISISLKPSIDDHFYRLSLETQDADGIKMGQFYITATNGHAWFYNFTIAGGTASESGPEQPASGKADAGSPAAGMPATATPGTLTMSGKVKVGSLPLSQYTTVDPMVMMKVYSENKWTDIVDASFDYDGMTSEYAASGFPDIGDTLLLRLIFRNQTERFTLPGNYRLDNYFRPSSVADPLSHDLEAYVVMHLVKPFDNAVLQTDIGDRASYASPVTFQWEAVPGVDRYVYKVDEREPTPPYQVATPVPLKSTGTTTITLDLKPSVEDHFYLLSLEAQDANGTKIGQFYVTASNGYGPYYDFSIK